MSQPSDIEISRQARPRPIEEIAAKLDIPESALYRYGPDKAKIAAEFSEGLAARPDAKLVLVTAISPTPAGEGKTTTTVGLGDALARRGERTAVCLREPSLGPCFGIKGGATGGGYAQVIPMEAINLHFTGDFHAIGAAHNLLSAMLDNHVYWGNALDLDSRSLSWRRVLDMNDRALRQIVSGLGGNGAPREDGFDITVASEVMAIFCLATDLADLKRRLGAIIVGRNRAKAPVTAHELQAEGAMAALLRDALMPNLVQTLEGTPALIHGGPFANIAHGCNSVIATRLGLKLADVVVTEAGFGADLGAEKFFDIKCRSAGLTPAAAVLVATVRALKMHGGVPRERLAHEDVAALTAGLANLRRHVENLRAFGVPVVVAINEFTGDTEAEYRAIADACTALGIESRRCTHWRDGGRGAEDLADAVRALLHRPDATGDFRLLYPDDLPLAEKIRTIATRIYRARDVELPRSVTRKLDQFAADGAASFPVCMAKTQYSFSTDAEARGAPEDHVVAVRDVRLANGAGFVVALCGNVMTMPGLPRSPAAERIDVDDAGQIRGLF